MAKNNDLIKYFTDQVEQKGYSAQIDGTDSALWEHIEDEKYSYSGEIMVYDEENEKYQTTSIYFGLIGDLEDGEEWIDEDVKIEGENDSGGFDDLKSKEEIDEFLKKRLKKFNNKKGVNNG